MNSSQSQRNEVENGDVYDVRTLSASGMKCVVKYALPAWEIWVELLGIRSLFELLVTTDVKSILRFVYLFYGKWKSSRERGSVRLKSREEVVLFRLVCRTHLLSCGFFSFSLLNEQIDRFWHVLLFIKCAFPGKTSAPNQIYQGMCASNLAAILC